MRSTKYLIIIVVSLTATAVFGKIIYVDDAATGANNGSSWQNAYKYLQDALSDAKIISGEISVKVAPGDQTSPAIWDNYIIWNGAVNETYDVNQMKIVEMPDMNITGSPAIWENKVVWADSNGYYDLSKKKMYYPHGLSIGNEPYIYANKIVWDDSNGYYDINLEQLIELPGLSIGKDPAIFDNMIVWSYSEGFYDITQQQMIYPEGLSIGFRPDIYDGNIVWFTSNSYYDTELNQHVPTDALLGWQPTIFNSRLGGTNYVPLTLNKDMYVWDDKCGIRRLTDSGRTFNAKIYGDIVTWQDRRNGNWDIYMFRLKDCCGSSDCPYPDGDLNHDCFVDIFDLLIITEHWLECIGSDCDSPLSISNVDLMASMPDPSAGYCPAMGYKYTLAKRGDGAMYGICIFPDGSTCSSWDFYRGIDGQKWSYASLCGYDQEDNGRNGWIDGALCVDKETGEELGSLYQLVVWPYKNGYPFYLPGDINKDKRVNFIDLSILVSNWLEE
jgi:beta propeller repeat protein